MAIQHPGSSNPPSLLRGGWSSRMWIASLSNSSLELLAWSITVVSSHLMGGDSPMHVQQVPTSPVFPSDNRPDVPSFRSRVSSPSPQHRPCRSCRGSGTQPWTASQLPGCPSLWITWSGRTVQPGRQPSC